MSNTNKIKIVFFSVFVIYFQNSFGQYQDFHSWSELTIEKKLTKNPSGGIVSLQHIIPVLLSIGLTKEEIENLIHYNPKRFLEIDVPKRMSVWSTKKIVNEINYNNGKILNPYKDEELIGVILAN